MVTATVLVPTHNHGRLLGYAVGSALAQTVSSIEVFIVGDGVDHQTRAVALGLVDTDPRVRFFDGPKGLRHGEALRHTALQHATGTIVCYLSDDDLWLPHHVETLLSALRNADFAHAVPIFVDASGRVQVHPGHLDAPTVRARLFGGFNFIPLSAAGHTLEFYRRLPTGWTPAPQGLPTDLHMWQQILSVNGCRSMSTTRATLLNFPARLRRDWTIEQRADELSRWSDRLGSPTLEADLATAALNGVMRAYVDVEDSARNASEQIDSIRGALARSEASVVLAAHREAGWHRVRTGMQQQIDDATNALAAATARAASTQRIAQAMEGTVTWRLRTALLDWKPIAAAWAVLRRSRRGSGV